MKNLRLILICLSAALPATVALAQDLNPTVEVTAAYQSDGIEVHKPALEMAVPDSVMNFRLDFDYSVAPNPYKGSYSFSPYVIDVLPESTAEKPGTFHLRVGVGYSLHPTVDVVYTPRFKTKSFSMSLYGTHRSYFGNFREVKASAPDADGTVTLDAGRKDKYFGYTSYTDAGLYGRVDWGTGLFSFDAGYTGYARRDTSLKRTFDMLHARLRVASRNDAPRYFFYDVSAYYCYGVDRNSTVGTLCPVPCAPGKASLAQHDISVAATLGPVFSPQSKLLFDVRFDLSEYSRYFDSYSGKFVLNPKYVFRKNRWFLNIGAEVSVLMGGDNTLWPSTDEVTYYSAAMHSRRGQYVYPDVEIGFDAVRDHLNLYLKAGGGDELNRYSSLVARNHYISLAHAWNYVGNALMDNTVEKINARFGLQGNIASKFSYNLYGGYAVYEGLPLDAVVASLDYSTLSPALAYADCKYWYAVLEVGWHSKSVTADGHISYVGTDLDKRDYAGFAPSPLKGGFNIVYNWRKRIYVGVYGEGTVRRTGKAAVVETYISANTGASHSFLETAGDCRLPGFFDLGLSGEYRFHRTLSVWLHLSNLLNQTIQLTPLNVSSGLSATVGITVDF